MPSKYDRCVKKVKASAKKSGKKLNPYAICTKTIGKYGGKPTKQMIDGRRVYRGERGGLFTVKNGRKIYIKF